MLYVTFTVAYALLQSSCFSAVVLLCFHQTFIFMLGDRLKNVWLVSSDRPSVEMKKIRFLVGLLKRYIGNLNKDFQYLHKCMILVTLLALQIHKNGIQ